MMNLSAPFAKSEGRPAAPLSLQPTGWRRPASNGLSPWQWHRAGHQGVRQNFRSISSCEAFTTPSTQPDQTQAAAAQPAHLLSSEGNIS